MVTSDCREHSVALQFSFIIRLVLYIGTREGKTTLAACLIDENLIVTQAWIESESSGRKKGD
tara:strand:- start:330 stop:515 length:186 start_codon:yes stop_codon:yes gene_type:complete